MKFLCANNTHVLNIHDYSQNSSHVIQDVVQIVSVYRVVEDQKMKNEDIAVATDQSRRRTSPHHKNHKSIYPGRH